MRNKGRKEERTQGVRGGRREGKKKVKEESRGKENAE